MRTPVLSNDGHDLAAAWRTIVEIGDDEALSESVTDAFPGAEVSVAASSGRFELMFRQTGLLRPLSQAELSDGTLRNLLLIAAPMTPRPPPLMVLNELQRVLCSDHAANHIQLDKELGETIARGQEMFDAPYWTWPKR